jgi:glycosyltransferase involved in cell wall biosynthesis/ribosomal protein S18 acetylase RimI-like enzyme
LEVLVRGPIRVAHVSTVDLTPRFLLLGQLRKLRDEGYEVAAISAPGRWTRDLESEGFHHVPWRNVTRSWNPRADLLAFLELIAILRHGRFDLVHTHTPKPGIMGRIAARLAGVPVAVNTVHGLYATPDDRVAKRLGVLAVERLAALFSDYELYQSEEDLRWARRIGLVSPRNSALLGNGIDLAEFDPAHVPPERVEALKREFGIPPDAVVVGAVGRLVAEKGYRELLTAARQVRSVVPEARFLVVGEPDPDKADAIGQEEIARAKDDVIFAGWREDVRDLLAVMDVFVLASWREGMPRSAIEAAAMGKALVLTDIRGCREVARDGLEGVLVPPRRPERLAEALLGLVRDRELRQQMGKAARARALERFDERRVEGSIISTYRKLLAGKGILAPGGVETTGELKVRRARLADAEAMARIHREALPTAFLPSLGLSFLKRLYRSLAQDRDGVALVAENGQGIVGFATGVSSVKAFYRRFLLRHGVPTAVSVVPRLVKRPRLMAHAVETARYPGGVDGLPESELLSIAIRPGWAAKGAGRKLAEGILRGLARTGAEQVKVVVAAENEGANRFYERVGFELAAQINVHKDEVSNVWVYRDVRHLR